MSAFACLSEFPGAIRNLFCTNEINARGKYRVRLYDDMKADWCEVTVDDLVPCKNGRPAFAQPNEGELWVLILEKAFAKHCNSYAGIDGGLTLWALHAMTGDHVFRLTRDDNSTTWERLNLKNHGTAAEPRKCGLYHCSPKEIHSPEKLWKLLKEYDRCNACLAASSRHVPPVQTDGTTSPSGVSKRPVGAAHQRPQSVATRAAPAASAVRLKTHVRIQ